MSVTSCTSAPLGNAFGENGFGENGFGENGFGENGFGENGFGENGVGLGSVEFESTCSGRCPSSGCVTIGSGATVGTYVSVVMPPTGDGLSITVVFAPAGGAISAPVLSVSWTVIATGVLTESPTMTVPVTEEIGPIVTACWRA